MLPVHPKALLALADGTVFTGISIGATGLTTGEVVFNTSLTGYQEILTDPSYCQQIVTLTYPHIGNTGVNAEDVEASRIHAAGLIIKDLPLLASNFRSTETLSAVPAARRHGGHCRPRHARTHAPPAHPRCAERLHRRAAGRRGRHRSAPRPGHGRRPGRAQHGRPGPGQGGVGHSALRLDADRVAAGLGLRRADRARFHVVAYDFGVKHNILRMLAERGCKVTVVPAQTPAAEVFKLKPDGVFLSNGPGDPEPCDYAIAAAREIIESGVPTFGICLGHQIMALASGAKTFKMKFGHHGANHPVKDLDSGRVSITSQNHGFAVDEKNLPANLRATHVSLFDGTLQGLARTDKPAFCFQGHPKLRPARTTSATCSTASRS